MKFSELRQKEVVNVIDGKRLGNIIDLDLNPCDGRIYSVTVPGPVKFSRLFRGDRCGVDIPWNKVIKIGDDVLLVEMDPNCFCALPG